MVDFVTFKSNDELPTVEMHCESMFWVDQAESFFNFLIAQGFIISERDLADYYAERAEEMKDLRSNTRTPSELELTMKAELVSAESEGGLTD